MAERKRIMENVQEVQSLIDLHFSAWLDRMQEPPEKLEAVTPYLESISKDFDDKLFEYIDEIQKDAYYAGFAEGVQLMQDCRAERQKITGQK
ncbi:MAG: hypothetical protein LUD12_05790 [Lachnospiraceae bacterium]|nr:hypothetical protein [Lachnospiraceae bacterium]